MQRFHPRLQAFSAFIEGERDRCDTANGNRLAFALGILLRKYHKLVLLHERAMPLVKRHSEHWASQVHRQSGALSDEQKRQILEASSLLIDIELNFESFFIYGAILCDDIAQLFLLLFGSARKIKLSGHRELSKNFGAYAEALSLSYDKEFIVIAGLLESDLCDYRDKQIVHDFHPRKTDALSFSNDHRNIQMTHGMLYPKDTDIYSISKPWGELFGALERYLCLFQGIVQDNREKSRFYVPSQPDA